MSTKKSTESILRGIKGITRRRFSDEEKIRIIVEGLRGEESIAVVRDLFLFQCYTGLAFADLAGISHINIEIGIDHWKWISINRFKTGIPCRIPLLPEAEEITDKYSVTLDKRRSFFLYHLIKR